MELFGASAALLSLQRQRIIVLTQDNLHSSAIFCCISIIDTQLLDSKHQSLSHVFFLLSISSPCCYYWMISGFGRWLIVLLVPSRRSHRGVLPSLLSSGPQVHQRRWWAEPQQGGAWDVPRPAAGMSLNSCFAHDLYIFLKPTVHVYTQCRWQ